MYKSINLTFKLFILFAVFVGLGLIAGLSLHLDASKGGFASNLYLFNKNEKISVITVFELLIYVLIGTSFMLLLSKIFKKKAPFLIIELISFLFAGFILTYGLFLYFEHSSHALFLSILLVIALALRRIIEPKSTKNIIAGMSAAGIGALLGISLPPFIAFLFILILTIYDVVSVFITKHMLDIAKIVTEHELAFTITATKKTEGTYGYKTIGKTPFRLDLGTGDLIVPVLFSVSLYSLNSLLPFIAYIASLFGFWIMIGALFLFKRPLPALLPIMGTSIIVTTGFAFVNNIHIF